MLNTSSNERRTSDRRRVPHPFASLWRKGGKKAREPVFHITLDDRWRIEATRHDTRLSHPTKGRLGGAPGYACKALRFQCRTNLLLSLGLPSESRSM